ncbi:MAG: PTS sugar transporter subunit IIA [bacterium]
MATLERSDSISVSGLLPEEVIAANLDVDHRDEVFEQLINLLADAGKVEDPEKALGAVKDREDILSTGIGNGVAIPHAKTDAVEGLVAAFGRVEEGVDFKSLDGKPARLIFLLLSPQGEAGLHVRALARISRMLKNTQFRSRLLETDSADEIIEIIQKQEDQQ